MLLGKEGRNPRLNSFFFFFFVNRLLLGGAMDVIDFSTQCIYGQTVTTSKQIDLGAAAATSVL